jgi:hypothetical protein
VATSANDEDRARFIRETQLAIAAETTRAEPIEEDTGRATTARYCCSNFFWIAILGSVVVGVAIGTGIVIGESRRSAPNELGAPWETGNVANTVLTVRKTAMLLNCCERASITFDVNCLCCHMSISTLKGICPMYTMIPLSKCHRAICVDRLRSTGQIGHCSWHAQSNSHYPTQKFF